VSQTESSEQQILQVARVLFTQKGYASVSIRDICRNAGITAPTLYYYFQNKEALFDAVVRETVTMTEFAKRLSNECAKVVEPDDRIRAFTRTYLTHFPKHLINTGLYLRHSTQLDAVGARTLSSGLAEIQARLIDLIREGVSKGSFRKTDARMAAECLLGMMHRFVFEQIHFKRNYDASAAASYLSDFFIRAMEPERQKRKV
jgi:AcrR family transcriptional regulator